MKLKLVLRYRANACEGYHSSLGMDVKECTALGRSGYLGAFYDAREDKFCHGSLFKTFNLPDNCVNRVDVTFSNIEYSFEDSYTKRFEKLDVSAELKVSVFAGLLDLKGSGKYLTDDKASSRSVKGTVLYNVRTKQETLNIYDEELKPFISLEGLAATSATHFVGGIVWGANTFASFEYRKSRASDLSAITGDLSAEMKRIVASIKGQGETRYEGLNENSSYNFDMKVYGDVIPGDEELPKTKKEALALMRKTPTYIANCNNGKGKPISFILYPLADVAKMMKVELQRQAQVLSIDSASVLQIEHVFNDLLDTKQVLNDFYEDLTSPTAPHFNPTLVHDVCTYKNNLEIAESVLRNKIREALVKARTDATQASLLQDVLKDFLETEFCPVKIKEFLGNCTGVQEKLEFISDLRAKNVNYLTSKSYGVDSIRSKEKNFYALVFHETNGLYSTDKWKKSYDLFFQLLTNRDEDAVKYSFYVLEMVSAEDDKDVSIYQCVESVVETENLYEVLLMKHSVPLARSNEIEFCAYKPNRSSPVKIRCPGSIHGNCALDVVQWKCDRDKCSSDLYYGFDGYIYCNCGKAKASSFSYKCPDPSHGAKWIKFGNEEDIIKMMEELIPPEEINLLILGETGVGKSTFINAFANYITFNTLDEAEESNLVSLIPTSFTVTDEDYTEKHVTFGSDNNESGKPGGSQTQACRSYTFPSGDRLIRLIDTPGIGDTHGVDRDVQNFENILSFITNYPILNGICILLKPNNSRISVMFRFCIQELLCHIHRSASENIVFLFTNARGTFYRPGDTLPSLRALLATNEKRPPHVKIPLNKSTIYCFDNESFRFLVAKKSNITFAEEEKDNFKSSWDRSVSECARLLEHVSKIKPHVVNDTISLNEARKLVIFLSKPLCDISQHIQVNILNIEDHERKIRQTGEDIAKLEKELYVPVKAWQPKPFDQPRTVCASAKCSTVRSFDDKKISDYTQICHDPCEVEDVAAEILNNPKLLNCWAMNNTRNCRVCGCSYEKHMHIYYENEEVEVQKIDSTVEEEIKSKEGVKQQKLKVLQDCKTRREKLEGEQKTITLASAKFAHFLKVNAITPYNDALKDYLQHLIVVEKQKCVNDPDNQRMVEDLTKMKGSYEEQVRILEQNFQSDGSDFKITPDIINDLVSKLYGLEINGQYIKEAVEAQKIVRKNHLATFSEKMYSPRSHRYVTNRRQFGSHCHNGQSQPPSLAQVANEDEPKKGIFKKMKNKLREFFFLDYEDGAFPESYTNGLAYN